MRSIPELNLGSIDAITYAQRHEKEFLSKIFLRDSFLEMILEEKKFFLIGEKGTGKTAYAVFLKNTEYKNTTSSISTLTGTDYAKFIHLKQSGHIKISNYSDIWKVILLLLTSHHLDQKVGGSLLQSSKFDDLKNAIDDYYDKAFSPEVVNALEFVENAEAAAALITKHAKVEGKIKESAKETGKGFQSNLSYIEREMKDAISSLKLSKNHIIFIDGIDIRPSTINFSTYMECIVGLAQAVWYLNTEFFANIKDSKGRIKVVLLIRPDILDSLQYQNLNAKIRDNGIILDWRTSYTDFKSSRIFQLIDGILGKQQSDDGYTLGDAWDYYFPYNLAHQKVAERTDNAFVGFLRYSFYRPRDVISYLLLMQEYVKLHEKNKDYFTERSFKNCQSGFSDYLLGEVRDHMSFYYSARDFDELIGFFSFLKGKSRFNWDDFSRAFKQFQKTISSQDVTLSALTDSAENFLQFLYSLNVVGYNEQTDNHDEVFVHWCFRDRTTVKLHPKVRAGLNQPNRPAYTIHPGLQRALNVGGYVAPSRTGRRR